MIHAVTPNPALDVSGTVDALVPNEKNYVRNEVRAAGGNALNAARILHRLGGPVVATGFLGGPVGDEICALLDAEGVPHRFIPIEANTRFNVTVSNQATHAQTRLSFPGPRVKATEIQKLTASLSKLKKPSLVLIGGSLPPGVTAAHLRSIVRRVSHQGIGTVVDVPGPILKDVIGEGPLLVKPNLTEFQEMTGTRVSRIPDVIREARKLLNAHSLMCISSVEGGALLVSPTESWFGQTPELNVRSTVGAGDSMVGAMSACLWRQRRQSKGRRVPRLLLPDLLRWGLAAASATLTEPGLQLGKAPAIRRFVPQILIREITSS